MVKIVESEAMNNENAQNYMAMNYRMEITEDREEGGYVVFVSRTSGCLYMPLRNY